MAESNVTFVVHKDWLDSIKDLPIDQQDKIIADFVRYGTETKLAHSSDPFTQAFVNILKGRIDHSKQTYKQKVQMSKTAGRKKKVNEMDVYNLARTGKSAKIIAEMLGCSKSAVDHSPGWKNRKNANWGIEQL